MLHSLSMQRNVSHDPLEWSQQLNVSMVATDVTEDPSPPLGTVCHYKRPSGAMPQKCQWYNTVWQSRMIGEKCTCNSNPDSREPGLKNVYARAVVLSQTCSCQEPQIDFYL